MTRKKALINVPLDESHLPRSAQMLRQHRKEKHLSQQDVAEIVGFEQQHYQRYEYGVFDIANASMRIGLMICHVLEIDPFELIFGNSQMK